MSKKSKNKKRGRPVGQRSHKKNKRYTPHLLRGMRDVLFEEQRYFDFFLNKAEDWAKIYGFEKLSLPAIEDADLFKRQIGLTSAILRKELFIFQDPNGHKVCLRPEATASVARVYIEHNLNTLTLPVKIYYTGSMFRFGRIHSDYHREFQQFGLEVVGSDKSVIDAQLILYVNSLLTSLGLKFSIQINNLGCSDCRKIYQKKLNDFIKQKHKEICSDCRHRSKRNPLRIFECQNKECVTIFGRAPHIVDFLCEECRNRFVKTLEFLDEAGLVYNLNPYIVRGSDYYDRTVFEFWADRSAEQKTLSVSSVPDDEKTKQTNQAPKKLEEEKEKLPPLILGGGGRYDRLIWALGGSSTPMSGVALGVDRIVSELKKQGIKIPRGRSSQLFVAQVGELARQRAVKIIDTIRQNGYRVGEALSHDGLRTQLDLAHKLGVKFTLILGQQEVIHKTIIIRDMNSGSQETVDQEKILREIRKRL